MHVKRKVAIVLATALVLGGLAATATAGVLSSLYTTPAAYSMIFGSSGNISKIDHPLGGIGPLQPGQCALIGVGDFTEPSPCSSLLPPAYDLTETPISSSNGNITYFAVTTTNGPAVGDRIVF